MQNPEINQSQPVPMANEAFVLCRGGIHFSAKAGPRSKVDFYGTLYLSTLRMVVVNDKTGAECTGFDMPLATLYKEAFNQPIFGANNMTGLSPPLDTPDGADHWKWCISFRNGGVGTFLPFFFRLLQEMRRRMAEAPPQQAQVRARRPLTSSNRPPVGHAYHISMRCVYASLPAAHLQLAYRLPFPLVVFLAGGAGGGAGGASGRGAGLHATGLRRPERPYEILHLRAHAPLNLGRGGRGTRPEWTGSERSRAALPR